MMERAVVERQAMPGLDGWARMARAALVVAGLSVLAACATPFEARVARFQQLPPPQGQTFVIEPTEERRAGGLEFRTYAAEVARQLQAQGFTPAADPAQATLVARLDFGIGPGRERIATRPGSTLGSAWGPGWGAWGPWGPWHRGLAWRHAYPFYWGWSDPFWGAPEVYSFTVYPAFVELDILRRADNLALFEGRAETTARTRALPDVVPNLVEAMFRDFPGRSGETVRVRIPR